TYSVFLARTAHITGTDASATACAFHVANLAVESSQARVPGFNSPGMTQYGGGDTPLSGILSRGLTPHPARGLNPGRKLTYASYADFEGVLLDGAQVSSTNASGDGALSGLVRFRVDRAGLPPLEGAIDYGQITLTGGNESGNYLVTLDGGTTVPVPTGPR